MDKDIMDYVEKQNKKFQTKHSPAQLHPLKELITKIAESAKPLSRLLFVSKKVLPSPVFNLILSNILTSILLSHSKDIDDAMQNIKRMEKTTANLDKEFNKQK